MGLLRIKTLLFLQVFLVFVFYSHSIARDYFWEFTDEVDLQAWQVLHTYSSTIENKSLVIRSDASPRIISPGPLRVTSRENAIWLRIGSSRNATGTIILKTAGGEVFLKRIRLFKDDLKDYRVYIGDVVPEGDSVVRFGIDFARNENVRVDYIRIFKPTSFELLSTFWYGFWEPDAISIKTINFITTPAAGPFSFITLLYAVVVLFSILFFFIYSSKNVLKKEALKRAVITSFILAGFLFALRMDYNWLSIWQEEVDTFSGRDVKERIKSLYVYRKDLDGFFDFMDFVHDKVPQEEKIRPADRAPLDPLAILAKYYLLPLKTSESGVYLWVYNEKDVSFDPAGPSIKKGGKVLFSPVQPAGLFKESAALYKVLGEGK